MNCEPAIAPITGIDRIYWFGGEAVDLYKCSWRKLLFLAAPPRYNAASRSMFGGLILPRTRLRGTRQEGGFQTGRLKQHATYMACACHPEAGLDTNLTRDR